MVLHLVVHVPVKQTLSKEPITNIQTTVIIIIIIFIIIIAVITI